MALPSIKKQRKSKATPETTPRQRKRVPTSSSSTYGQVATGALKNLAKGFNPKEAIMGDSNWSEIGPRFNPKKVIR